MTASLPILLVAAHLVGDYIAQNDWMSARKLVDWRVRLVHVLAYAACFAPVAAWALPARPAALFVLAIAVPHYAVDCRRWASGDRWPPKPILVDQSLHLLCIGLAAAAFGL